MNKLFGIVVLVIILLPQSVVAGCWVDDGTFFSKSRMNMSAFTIYMDRKADGDFDRVLAMVDNRRVGKRPGDETLIERRTVRKKALPAPHLSMWILERRHPSEFGRHIQPGESDGKDPFEHGWTHWMKQKRNYKT
jgi:hypothetical protein